MFGKVFDPSLLLQDRWTQLPPLILPQFTRKSTYKSPSQKEQAGGERFITYENYLFKTYIPVWGVFVPMSNYCQKQSYPREMLL